MSDDSTQTVFVRPYGYAAEQPVVRRLGDRDCFIGNAAAAEPNAARGFDQVLSLTREPRERTTRHCPLTDDAENDWPVFARAADTARDLLARDGETLIHCKVGVSRSSAVTAAALAVRESRPFVDALHEVQNHRQHAVPHPALHEYGVCYVAAQG